MFEIILTTLFAIFAVVFAITGTMRASAGYDNIDRRDIVDYNIKEMWFLVWDHREEYYACAGFLALTILSAVF